jgi:hypothetical protein
MSSFENEPTETRSMQPDYTMVEDLSLYEISRDELIATDHLRYAKDVVSKINAGLAIDDVITVMKYDLVRKRMDNVLVAQYLNDLLSGILGTQQFDRFMNLEDK